MIGAFHAAGLGRAADYNVKRRKFDEAQMSQGTSVSNMILANHNLVASNEWGDARRAKPFMARLHAAKFIKCDPMLKELFFPILNNSVQFGFTSVSRVLKGLTASDFFNNVSDPYDPPSATEWAKSRGPWRGIACFTLRSNRIDDPVNVDRKLNSRSTSVGVSGFGIAGTATPSNPIQSSYRRFYNGPATSGNGGSAAYPYQPNCPEFAATTSVSTSNIKNLEVGFRADLESKAVQSSNFQHSIGSSTSSEGTTTVVPEAGATNANWTGEGRVITTSGNDRAYFQNLRETTMRFADGYLELDISNGKTASCLVEVVIHAYKKNEVYTAENAITDTSDTQKLYKAIWQGVEFQQRDVTINTADIVAGVNPGGWQSLFDPKYPLLACKSAHRKPADDIAKEVHRSSHCLSPGMSKTIRIYLGSLYYQLGSQSTHQFDDTNNSINFAGSFGCSSLPVGALQVTIGHSGFDQLTAPTAENKKFSVEPDAYNGDLLTEPGMGFWVGKQCAPSEIVATGIYKEKFYPAYVISKERTPAAGASLLPVPSVRLQDQDEVNYAAGLPGARPVTNVIGTVDADDGGVPANNTDPSRMDL